jgi:hypothetical protein
MVEEVCQWFSLMAKNIRDREEQKPAACMKSSFHRLLTAGTAVTVLSLLCTAAPIHADGG